MGKKRSKLAFRYRPVAQSELCRDIVEPARCKAAIEMTQSGNDHPGHRHLDVGSRLVEHQKIEAGAARDIHAGKHLVARGIERTELRAGAGLRRRLTAWRQERVIRKTQRGDAIEARFLARA